MARYIVVLPITGTVCVEVEASSNKEAIDKAFERDENWPQPEEWNVHDRVCEGNVFHGTLNEAYAEKVREEES